MAIAETKLPLKLLVDRKTNKVIFAEAGSEIVDVIFGFLTLPLATIIRQLDKHCGTETKGLECFNNLYASLENLPDSYFSEQEGKHFLLHPYNASVMRCQKLKLQIDDSASAKYYCCPRFSSGNGCRGSTFTTRKGEIRCSCSETIRREVRLPDEGGFADKTKVFIITDDLRVLPSLDDLSFKLIQNEVGKVDAPEEKILDLGLNEVMHLLNFSLISETPLTNLLHLYTREKSMLQASCEVMHLLNLLFSRMALLNILHLHLKYVISSQEPPDSGIVSLTPETTNTTEDSKKFVIKALIHKTTHKLLFFLAGGDFVEFLFRLLAIPLGSLVSLSGGNSNLGRVDNLYTSISKLSPEYLSLPKSLLINPRVSNYNVIKNSIQLFYIDNKPTICPGSLLLERLGDHHLIKASTTFKIDDDLKVTPMSSMSIITHLCSLKVAASDVREVAINIGSKEVLDILMVSSTSSTSALSKALFSSSTGSSSQS